MTTEEIDRNVRSYLDERRGTARYSSFDYCFNYFQAHHDGGHVATLAEAGQMQTSCLQLGFYLASWGMFRGRAQLLTRSVKCFEPVVEVIVKAPRDIWKLDVGGYTPEAIEALVDVGRQLRAALPGGRSDTLVTKTMLGVFGCVPAFDRYFRVGLGLWKFGPKSLLRIRSFYEEHADAIDSHLEPTLDFDTGQPTERLYTRAKVIDMIFFIAGGA
jgi:hypothetical protein